MPDFTRTFSVAGNLPEKLDEHLHSLATSASLDLRKVSTGEGNVTITIHVTEGSSAPAREIAEAFFEDVMPLFSGLESNGALRVESSSPSSAELWGRRIALGIGALVLFVSLFLVGWLTLDRLFWLPLFMLAVSASVGLPLYIFGKRLFQALESASPDDEQEKQAAQERALVQEVARGEDPAVRARLEFARVTLRVSASSMRRDADRLWRRSIWAYRGALIFFLMALAGPVVAAMLLLTANVPDWHFMFGGLSLAAVPLLIGTALLRHDTKLRDQYQDSARDVAALDRYELALAYSRVDPSPQTHQGTLQQVITQLLASRTAIAGQPPTGANVDSKGAGHKNGEEEVHSLKAITEAAEKLREVATSFVQTKGG